MAADVLSDLVRTMHDSWRDVLYVVARESWLAEQLPHEMILPKILPVADGLIASGSYLRGSSPD